MMSTKKIDRILDLMDDESVDTTELRAAVDDYIEDIEWDHENELDDAKNKRDRAESALFELTEQIKQTTLEDDMWDEWYQEAKKKYTLTQVESIFGTKFNLKEFKDVKILMN